MLHVNKMGYLKVYPRHISDPRRRTTILPLSCNIGGRSLEVATLRVVAELSLHMIRVSCSIGGRSLEVAILRVVTELSLHMSSVEACLNFGYKDDEFFVFPVMPALDGARQKELCPGATVSHRSAVPTALADIAGPSCRVPLPRF